MTPLSTVEHQELDKGNYAVKFSVHKHNSYITDRTITLEEATRCVVYQTKWAASHEIVALSTNETLMIEVNVLSAKEIEGMGKFVVVGIDVSGKKHKSQFIVTESKSHWFFLDYGLADSVKSIEVEQGNTPTAAIAKYS